jgi:hypothetical protein
MYPCECRVVGQHQERAGLDSGAAGRLGPLGSRFSRGTGAVVSQRRARRRDGDVSTAGWTRAYGVVRRWCPPQGTPSNRRMADDS